MKTLPRMQSVYTSLPQWELTVDDFPAREVTLFRLIRVASLGITAIAEPVLRPDGLTESSYHALITVAAAGPSGLSLGELCELIGQTRPNITRIVRLLDSRNLITVHNVKYDGRSKIAAITEAGKALTATRGHILGRLFAIAEGTLTPAEKKTLERLLRKVLVAMDGAEDEAMRAAAAVRQGITPGQSPRSRAPSGSGSKSPKKLQLSPDTVRPRPRPSSR